MGTVLLIVALICAIYGVISSMIIVSFLSSHGVKINYLLLRLLLLKYVGQYRKINLEEKGKPGFLYYSFIISMNSALVLGVIGLILLALSRKM
jgi:uncharacterized oligopeptide transporter (OPT) family protein